MGDRYTLLVIRDVQMRTAVRPTLTGVAGIGEAGTVC